MSLFIHDAVTHVLMPFPHSEIHGSLPARLTGGFIAADHDPSLRLSWCQRQPPYALYKRSTINNDLFDPRRSRGSGGKILEPRSSIAAYLNAARARSALRFSAPLVGSRGLEPPTSRLSGARSNLLSYEPVFASRCFSFHLARFAFPANPGRR